MDLSSIGINSALIVGIVSITELIKTLDKKSKFKKYYILVPLILGAAASFLITKPLVTTDVIVNAIIYAGVSGFMYKSGKLALTKKGKNNGKDGNR
jgi:Ca2+/Na+ antiporter